MNYDIILNRRLWKDIHIKVDYSYYKIKDYVASNWDYARYPTFKMKGGKKSSVPGIQTPPGLEGSDMYINLDEVIRHGVEVEMAGSLLDNLSFYVSYAYQKFDYDGTEPAGMELGDVAKHRINAGLCYHPFEKTLVMLDYKYQDEQVAHNVAEKPEGSGNWTAYDNPMDAYHVFDLGVEQTIYSGPAIQNLMLGFYVNNLFDEEYENTRGFPMTDRTFIGAVSFLF